MGILSDRRYGPHNGEWYAAAGVSFVIFTLTLILVGVSLCHSGFLHHSPLLLNTNWASLNIQCPPSFDKVMLTDAHDPDLEAHVQPPQPPPHQE